MTQDQSLLDYLLLLRYGTYIPSDALKQILSLTAVAKVVQRPRQTVSTLITLGLQHAREGRSVQPRRTSKLSEHHVAFLTSPNSLLNDLRVQGWSRERRPRREGEGPKMCGLWFEEY